jgi:uncharacterized protein YlxP (DUF503 family)
MAFDISISETRSSDFKDEEALGFVGGTVIAKII